MVLMSSSAIIRGILCGMCLNTRYTFLREHLRSTGEGNQDMYYTKAVSSRFKNIKKAYK